MDMRNMKELLPGLLKGLAAFAALALCAVSPAFARTQAAPRPAAPSFSVPSVSMPSEPKLVWQDDLDTAFALGISGHKPVFVLFSSPDCGWCSKLKSETLADSEVVKLLQSFSTAEVDVTKDALKASQYQVRGVPTVMIFSSDGRVLSGFSGYAGAPELAEMLKRSLNPEFLKKMDAEYLELLKQLSLGSLPPERLSAVMKFLGSRERRKELHDKVMALSPFPKKALAALLDNESMAVRLGALEILEEAAGDIFGFDPWLPPGSEGNLKARESWKAWAEGGDAALKVHSAFTPEQLSSYIRSLVSEDREASNRALRMLEQGGQDACKALSEFIEAHPSLPPGSKGKLKVAQYSLSIPQMGGQEPSALAFGLVFGNEDQKLKSLGSLALGGKRVIPVLKDFLDDPDSMIRESAVDALAGAGGRSAVPLFAELLSKEKDQNVVYAVLRALGGLKSLKGLELLLGYADSPNEDLAVAAINSVAKLKSRKASDALLKSLDDPRWRVRVAALDAIMKIEIKEAADKVSSLLDDKDDFVRLSAVKALAKISATGKAAKKLEELFLKDDQLKGSVAEAFCSLDITLPKSFEKALDGKSPDVLLSVIGGLKDCKEGDLSIPLKLSESPDKDVACAAASLLARKGAANARVRGRLIQILKSGPQEMASSVLESLVLKKEGSSEEILEISELEDSSSGSEEAKEGSLGDVLSAFEGAPAPAEKAAPAKEKPVSVNDLADAFGFDSSSASEAPESGKGSAPPSPFKELLDAVESFIEPGRPEDLRFRALAILARQGSKRALAELSKGLPSYTVSQRAEILESLEESKLGKEAIPLLRELLKDKADNVREDALRAVFRRNAKPEFMDLVFEELLTKGSPLKPLDFLKAYSKSGVNKRNSGKWVSKILSDPGADPQLQTLALVLLENCWGQGSEAEARRFLRSESPWQRRAAAYSLGRCSVSAFKEIARELASDPSEFVRIVLPLAHMRGSSEMVVYLDEKSFASSYNWSSLSPRAKSSLSPEAKAETAKLCLDPSTNVRLEAFFCLLSNREPFDLEKFIETVDSLPDRSSAQNRIADYVNENYKQLGPEFRALVPLVERSRRERSENLEKIYKHFNINPDEELPAEPFAGADKPGKPVQASFLQLKEEPAAAAPAETPMKMVFFSNPGCKDCERVQRMIPELRGAFPSLQIEFANIRKQAAMRLNEALCERFGVPEESRLVAPAIFCGAGYLLKKDIEFDRLCGLIAKSSGIPAGEWLSVPEEELRKAGDSIRSRFSEISWLLVAAAGLLDGVNPCAFATIIFLLSYLQVARRSPSQIAQVGIAFILGVFLAYFLLGLGLVEVVTRLPALRHLGMALNWALAAFCLLIMALSVRDGVLCLQGRLSDISLQLPEFLKRAIHATIRRGARHSHFVVAAFVIGVAISFLELACTGQVYAPTIMYMMQEGGRNGMAVAFLGVYNVAFILPLVAIFLLSYSGMRSESFSGFMARHAALVKFGTAALFLAIFLAFVFGGRILDAPELLGSLPPK